MVKKRVHPVSARPGEKGRAVRCGPSRSKQRAPGAEPEEKAPGWLSEAGLREIIESVAIALVLAFLFRTFEAEAFVIPTGSMAPTLMGRHKDLVCQACGYPFQVSASEEVDKESGVENGNHVVGCTCPMCRYTMSVGPNHPSGSAYPSFKGDRILVAKYPYQFGQPRRWDVAVFRFPGKARVNFIKRVVGLPGETIRIHHGDVFVRGSDQAEFTIARKTPDKILATLQPVYDNDYAVASLIEAGWPARWSGEPGPDERGQWVASSDFKSFSTDGTGRGVAWLGYQHVVPSWEDWIALRSGTLAPDRRPKPQLITDFAAYNTDEVASEWKFPTARTFVEAAPPRANQLGLHWVGDLALECELEIGGDAGQVLFELVEGGRRVGCQIDVGSGEAAFSVEGLRDFRPTLATRLKGRGRHRVMLANVDDQLVFWVDGRAQAFPYGPLPWHGPTGADLQPARIGSQGVPLVVRHLRLLRDIYYIGYDRVKDGGGGQAILDFDPYQSPYRAVYSPDCGYDAFRRMVPEVLSDPQQWGYFALSRQFERTLAQDQYLMLGDNSAESLDSRLWGDEFYVRRELLIGKALVIYWPHGWYIPGLGETGVPVLGWPIVPNFGRFKLVR